MKNYARFASVRSFILSLSVLGLTGASVGVYGLCAPGTYAGTVPILTCAGTNCSGLSVLGYEYNQTCQAYCCPVAGSGYYYPSTCSASISMNVCCAAGSNACSLYTCGENCSTNGYPN